MSFLKPKTKTTSTPTNQFAGQLNTAYSPSIATGNASTNFLGDILGVNSGDPSAAFEKYKEMAGFAPALSALQQGVTGGAASKGLLNSGSTQKALLKEGANLNNSTFNNFLQQLAGLSGIGLQGGNIVSGAGNMSTSTTQSPSTAGTIGSVVGGIASLFSDRRLKHDIVEVGEFEDGLPIYTFKYLGETEGRIGVMADEVEIFRPWARGPDVGGFATVNYGAL